MNRQAQARLLGLIDRLEAEALRLEGIRCHRCAANRRFDAARLRRELEAGG